MEIILLEKIANVGDVGDLVKVKNGYARNYLIPQKKAMLATSDAKAEVEEKKRQLAQQESQRLEEANKRAESIVREISLTRLCGEEGQLYGSVSPIDIAEALTEAGTEVEKSEINQPEGPIKHTGSHEAEVVLHPEVKFSITINVHGEEGENPIAEVEETAGIDDDAVAEADADSQGEDV